MDELKKDLCLLKWISESHKEVKAREVKARVKGIKLNKWILLS